MTRQLRKRFIRMAALALAAMALSAPIANARPAELAAGVSTAQSTEPPFVPGVTDFPRPAVAAADAPRQAAASGARAERSTAGGVDWRDFGVGMAAGIAIMGLGAVVLLLARPALAVRRERALAA